MQYMGGCSGLGNLNHVSIFETQLWRICDLPHHIYGGHVGFPFALVDASISLSYLRSLLLKMWVSLSSSFSPCQG